MKITALFVWTALLTGLVAGVAGAERAAMKTYSLVADRKWSPPTEAQARAAWREVDAAMSAHGFAYSAEPRTADTVITVRFMRRGYEIDFNENIPHSCHSWAAARLPSDQEYAKAERRRLLVERLIETGKN